MARKGGMAAGVEVARISVKVSPDTRDFRRQLKRELEEIERTLKGDIEVNAHLDSAQVRSDFRRMMAQMQREGSKGIKVKAEVGVDDSGVDKTKKTLLAFGKGGGNGGIFSKMLKMPNFGSGINFTGYALLAGLLLNVLAPAIGLITTGLMAIPGLIALIAAPIGAVTLGLQGFAEAAKTIDAPFRSLQETMSAAAKTEFTPVFERLAPIMETLKGSLPTVTAGLADLANGLIDGLTANGGMEKIDQTIRNIGTALSNAAPGLRDFAAGFLDLAESFTGGALQDLTEWFNGAGKSFKDFIADFTRADWFTGESKMDVAFQKLGDTLKVVMDLMGSLGEKGLNFLTQPEGLDSFINQLEQIATLVERIMDASVSMNSFFDKFQIPDWMKDIGNVLDSRGEGDKPFFERSIGQQLAGGLGHNFQEQMKAAFGNEESKKYMDDLYSYAEERSAEAGQVAGTNLMEGLRDLSETPAEGELFGGGGSFDTSKIEEMKSKVAEVAPMIQAVMEPINQIPAQIQTSFGGIGAAVQGSMGVVVGVVVNAGSQIQAAFTAALANIPTAATTQFASLQGIAQSSMAGVVSAITNGANQSVAAVQNMATQIQAALQQAASGAQAAGQQIGNGMAAGIQASTGAAVAAARSMAAQVTAAARVELGIKSPSKVFEQIGIFTGEGMGVGMEKGFGPVIDQAKDLSQQVADAFATGQDPTTALSGFDKGEISRIEKALGLEIKRLEAQAKALDYQAKMSGNDALKTQAEAIRMRKEELGLQKDMLDLAGEYNDETASGSSGGTLEEQVSKMLASPVDFAKATGKQFLNDIGLSGDGFIGKALTEGTKYIFQIGSVDEALSIKDREDRKSAMSIIGPRG